MTHVTLNQPLDLGLIGAALSHAGCSLAAPPSLPETVTDDLIMEIAGRDELTGDAILRFARDLLAHIGKRPAMSEDAALSTAPAQPTTDDTKGCA